MNSKNESELYFICDTCGYQELPSYAFTNKMNDGEGDAEEIPSHCSETMRLTVLETKLEEEIYIDIDIESTKWSIKEMVKLYFTKTKGSTALGEAFTDKYDSLLLQSENETDLARIHRLRESVEPALQSILPPGEGFDPAVQMTNQLIDGVLAAARARMGTKKKKQGPIMPGSDPSFDIKYFCTVCKEYQEIPEEEKRTLLESSSIDRKLPLHHNKEVEIRIAETQKPRIEQIKLPNSSSISTFISSENVEQLTLLSVGVDIGSSTSHLIFSRLTLQRETGFLNLSNRFNMVEREILYEGEIINTPLLDSSTIDIDAVVAFCEEEYRKAGYDPELVDTGAVIVTGEAAKKHNAAEIVARLSEETGKFVSATAGPNFESVLAAMGSGAVVLSREKKNTILSVDVGGGTSNLAISSNGQVLSTSCINVGGRLLGIDEDFKIWRINDPTLVVMSELNMEYSIGDIIPEEDVRSICQLYTESLIEVMKGPATSPVAKALMMTDDLDFSVNINEILFCGGVSEFIYGDSGVFNDIGRYIAEELNAHDFGIPIIEPKNKIRATVIGAGSYSLSVSGSTCYFDKNIEFPLENIPILLVNAKKDDFSQEHLKKEITLAFKKFDMTEGKDMVALYFKDPIHYRDLYLPIFAKAIENSLPHSVANKKMIILLFAGDLGSMVGITIHDETAIQSNLICLDELMLDEGDWVDIGAPLYSGEAFPVTVKSLVFNQK